MIAPGLSKPAFRGKLSKSTTASLNQVFALIPGRGLGLVGQCLAPVTFCNGFACHCLLNPFPFVLSLAVCLVAQKAKQRKTSLIVMLRLL